MHREIYHLASVHELTATSDMGTWMQTCLANARAAFLQQLGLTSARLRAEGMRLGLEAENAPLPADPELQEALGVTLTLRSSGESFTFTERLYDAGDFWHPLWQGVTRVWAETEGQPRPLPWDLVQELQAWLHLSRGSVPVPSNDDCPGIKEPLTGFTPVREAPLDSAFPFLYQNCTLVIWR